MTNILERLIRGNALRKTRLHDEKGNFTGVGGLLDAPAALTSALLRAGFGYRPARPMISYRGARAIARLLTPRSRGVEFGSGMSTLWFARRCGSLVSIENDDAWHRKVSALLAANEIANVDYRFRGPEEFSDMAEFEDGSFDFALVDGWDRAGCVANVLPKIAPGGFIYLDNSDKDMTRPGADLRRAEERLLRAVAEGNGAAVYFSDFSPTNFFVEQGLLARF